MSPHASDSAMSNVSAQQRTQSTQLKPSPWCIGPCFMLAFACDDSQIK